jgi:hypothetical protein
MKTMLVRASVALYRALLRLYPADHRRTYGAEMTLTFRDMAQAAYARRRSVALLWLWAEILPDTLTNATIEHVEALRGNPPMSRKSLVVLSLALVCSLLTGYVNVTATEVLPPMLCILLFSGLTGLLQPKGAWRWAALIGLSIPISTFVGLAINFHFVDAPPRYPITLVVLVISALIAAYLGVLLNHVLTHGSAASHF